MPFGLDWSHIVGGLGGGIVILSNLGKLWSGVKAVGGGVAKVATALFGDKPHHDTKVEIVLPEGFGQPQAQPRLPEMIGHPSLPELATRHEHEALAARFERAEELHAAHRIKVLVGLARLMERFGMHLEEEQESNDDAT